MSMDSLSTDSLSMGPLSMDPLPMDSLSMGSWPLDCPTPDLCHHRAQGSSGSARVLVKLSNVAAYGLRETSLLQRPHTFDLIVHLGERSRTCRGKEFRDGVFHWEDPEYFTDVVGGANLELQVWSDHRHDYGRFQSSMSSLRFDQSGTHEERGCFQHETRTWQAVLRKPLLGAAFYRQKGAEIEFTLSVTTLGSRVWLERRCTQSPQGSRQASLMSETSR